MCVFMLVISPSGIRIRRDSLWGDGQHEAASEEEQRQFAGK
jgi:hypothetical protein